MFQVPGPVLGQFEMNKRNIISHSTSSPPLNLNKTKITLIHTAKFLIYFLYLKILYISIHAGVFIWIEMSDVKERTNKKNEDRRNKGPPSGRRK